jgi:hypothetical protein
MPNFIVRVHYLTILLFLDLRLRLRSGQCLTKMLLLHILTVKEMLLSLTILRVTRRAYEWRILAIDYWLGILLPWLHVLLLHVLWLCIMKILLRSHQNYITSWCVRLSIDNDCIAECLPVLNLPVLLPK